MPPIVRRANIVALALVLVTVAAPNAARAAGPAGNDWAPFQRETAARHGESVKRLQDWIALPSIAAESLNSQAGADRMAQLAREAGFQLVSIVPTASALDSKARTISISFIL